MSNLLEGGELVLTTGLALLDVQHRDAYLPGLAAAGAAGVIIELGMHIDELPESVLASGVSLGLPVIVLHRRVRFVDVTEEVHRRIVADQYAEVDYARRAHETFTALSMRRASLNEIVEVAAGMLGSALVLEDLNRQVLAYARHGTPTTELLDDWDRRSRLTPSDGPGGWLTRPVGPYRHEWGRLIAPTAEPTDRAVMTVERCAQALALHRMVEQDRTSLELRAQSGLVDDLRRGAGARRGRGHRACPRPWPASGAHLCPDDGAPAGGLQHRSGCRATASGPDAGRGGACGALPRAHRARGQSRRRPDRSAARPATHRSDGRGRRDGPGGGERGDPALGRPGRRRHRIVRSGWAPSRAGSSRPQAGWRSRPTSPRWRPRCRMRRGRFTAPPTSGCVASSH